ncbi:MAG: Thymidylate kinase [Candidatus Argoarchaeum ethanivorans]|uniref:Thymidylate kinase n=1 Tax=Candidatus Argoarchaeum ethanivorans TaxID=2608793 RepID=A0A811TEH1_9EURY|nr:MAG: Thymidylate kinase [Candidatus Argoarchaeum ethanivorans]
MAIEGIDGCGKTTQANMLVDRLKKEEIEATYVRPIYVLLNLIRLGEVTKNPVSPRRARASNKKSSILQRAVMGLFGYPYAITTYIYLKLTSKDKIIVCDRYFYQFFFDLFGEISEKVIRIFPKSDITFFLDGNLDIFYSRMDNSFINFSIDIYANFSAGILTSFAIRFIQTSHSSLSFTSSIFQYLRCFIYHFIS